MFSDKAIKTEVRNVTGITEKQEDAIRNFLQGAVYCWCKNRPGEWFAMRDLMGGDNYYWNGTPLIELYNKHIKEGKEGKDAVEAAGRDSGWLLKKVISKDKRTFDTKKDQMVRMYKWDGDASCPKS